MKTTTKTVTTLFVMITLFFTLSCKGKNQHKHEAASEKTMTSHEMVKEYDSDYVCPMHCEGSGSDQEGKCPKCGMTYVVNAEHVKDGHTH